MQTVADGRLTVVDYDWYAQDGVEEVSIGPPTWRGGRMRRVVSFRCPQDLGMEPGRRFVACEEDTHQIECLFEVEDVKPIRGTPRVAVTGLTI